MAYSPYLNYTDKLKKEADKEKEKKKQIEIEKRTLCDGIVAEKITSDEKKRLIQNSMGHGLCFTDPYKGTKDMCLTEKIDTAEERMIELDGLYYYE